MFLKTKLKLIILILVICIIFLICVLRINFSNQNTKFSESLCQNGYAKRWVGACICNNPSLFSGRYCNEKAIKKCTSNHECPQNSYCMVTKNQGACFNTSIRGSVVIKNVDYVLSDSLLSYDNAQNFCSALGENIRPASRKDFDCDKEGSACLKSEKIIKLQKKFGTTLFFWLDEVPNSKNAYYADLNDGTVYNTQKNNFKFAQVLCVRKK